MESNTNQHHETEQKANPTTPTKTSQDIQRNPNPDSDLKSSSLKWEGVFGLENAKQILQERILFPCKYPDLFAGFSRRGAIFLFGPPGVGKTHFVKAAAKEFGMNLLCYQPADFMSKYIGDPEKILIEAFKEAQEKQPAILFFDDIDYLFSNRQDHGSEGLRRVKTEFLIQYEHLPKDSNVFVIGAGNRPWDFDLAVRKRFDLRIHIKLPDSNTRELLFKDQLSKVSNTLALEDFTFMANQTEGFSSADVICLARELTFEPLREISKVTHFRPVDTLPDGKPIYEPCLETDEEAKEMGFMSIGENQLKLRPVEMEDFKIAITKVRKSIGPELIAQYEDFENQFGTV